MSTKPASPAKQKSDMVNFLKAKYKDGFIDGYNAALKAIWSSVNKVKAKAKK